MDPRQRRLVVRELPRRVRRRRPRPRRVALPHQLRGAYPHRGCIERFNTTQPASISIASELRIPNAPRVPTQGPRPPILAQAPICPLGARLGLLRGARVSVRTSSPPSQLAGLPPSSSSPTLIRPNFGAPVQMRGGTGKGSSFQHYQKIYLVFRIKIFHLTEGCRARARP